MRRPYQQILGSISATFVLSLIALAPFWIADTIEPIETADNDIHSYEEVASTTTEQVITPWWQFRNETSFPGDCEGFITDTGAYFECLSWTPIYFKNPSTLSWDIDGYWDWFTVPESTPVESSGMFVLKGGISASQMLVDGIRNISVGIEYNGPYQIFDIEFARGMDYGISEATPAGIPTEWMETTYIGQNWFNFTVDQTLLQDTAYWEGMYIINTVDVIISFPTGYSQGELVKTNYKICPEYLIENVTVEGNTTYKPYILKASNPYTWVQWSMGFSGFFFVLTTVVVNPWINPLKYLKMKSNKKIRNHPQ